MSENDVDVGGEPRDADGVGRPSPPRDCAADVSAEPATDRIAKAIARRQMKDLDWLLSAKFAGEERRTVAWGLYLAARDVIEREVANR